jgi:hypothetical protein
MRRRLDISIEAIKFDQEKDMVFIDAIMTVVGSVMLSKECAMGNVYKQLSGLLQDSIYKINVHEKFEELYIFSLDGKIQYATLSLRYIAGTTQKQQEQHEQSR